MEHLASGRLREQRLFLMLSDVEEKIIYLEMEPQGPPSPLLADKVYDSMEDNLRRRLLAIDSGHLAVQPAGGPFIMIFNTPSSCGGVSV